MDSVERDQRAESGFSERGNVLYRRDSGEKRKKGKLDLKPRPRARFENEPQISVLAGDPVIEKKVTPGASRKQEEAEYDPNTQVKSKDVDKWQQKKE